MPWHDEPVGSEVNLSFTLEKNLIRLSSVRIDNHEGRFILGTATPESIVDSTFPLPKAKAHRLSLGEKEIVRIKPVRTSLGGVADAIVGAEVWGAHAITIDYRSGLVSFQKEPVDAGTMSVFQFQDVPMINVIVDGREIPAVVDTTSPDTVVMPSDNHRRANQHVLIGNTDLGLQDVRYASIEKARVGNRVLSKFLVTIDYGKKMVALWRDPRVH
jgi:hypothetical protein